MNYDPDGIERLARAVLILAVRDYQRGDCKARVWLLSTGAELWLDVCGINPEAVHRGLTFENLIKPEKIPTTPNIFNGS